MIFSGFCSLKFCSISATRAESFLIKFKGAATTLATGTYGSRVRTIFTSARAVRLWRETEALAAKLAYVKNAFSAQFRDAASACVAEALSARLADSSRALLPELKRTQQILLGRDFAAGFGYSAQISSLQRGSKAQILSAELGVAERIFSARRGGTTGAISSRYDRTASISSAKFLKFSRATYLKNAAHALLARSGLSGIFKNFSSLEFRRGGNFRGFKFNAWSGGSALWSR